MKGIFDEKQKYKKLFWSKFSNTERKGREVNLFG